ncbi:alpha-mannosidase [Calothrix sp. 336/3]|uniref:alpha-mannosidase n=1 Tax=Calothrix sp. 336/3 TaxID=1337936 RepID=UPI0004E33955|nr:alpha-mannosidase [Calothrix sp. 336/3]AKG23581.1 alpha-mannosidase [Calothrix sp. 336/3]
MTSPDSTSCQTMTDVISRLRSYSQLDIQSHWYCQEGDLSLTEVMDSNLGEWQVGEINSKGYITWSGGRRVLWLVQKLIIPADVHGYPLGNWDLYLALVWWADSAKIFLNGEFLAEGDLFDCSPRILISSGVKPGEELTLAVRLVSPGHCDGALVRSRLDFQSHDGDNLEPGFLADELDILRIYGQTWENEISSHHPHQEVAEFFQLRNSLRSRISNYPHSIFLLGHAHLDMAWLWRVCETWQAAENTFESVLNLQQEFPELIFCHSTPALYAWVEKHRPDLFRKIQDAVAQGKWEIVGGFWVEPDLNLIDGESIARQLLYGQRYIQEKFGQSCTIVWVPDTFGFCWTLPQFLQQGGIDYFVTQKLRWNDTTKFPHEVFYWRSPDGSQVFSFMSAPIGEGINPVKMAEYGVEWAEKTGTCQSLWLPGVGDHGGGPTRDMLETARRWQKSAVFPPLEFTTAQKYLNSLATELSQKDSPLPIWNDELYLEFHRGCYTTHADQKRWNRYCENLLYQAELFASLATISCGVTYPQESLETAWKTVLFQQFHDILPGSSIPEVYSDALPEWQAVAKTGEEILENSLRAIASQVTLPPSPTPESFPLLVFNSLNWQRSQVVTVSLPTESKNCSICDAQGNPVVSQLGENSTLLFLAEDIPSVGYRLYWLVPNSVDNQHVHTDYNHTKTGLRKQLTFSPETLTLENDFLQVKIDKHTGNLISIFDRINYREILHADHPGNQLQFFQDNGQYWDAWNINPNYNQHPLPSPTLTAIQCLEAGAVQIRVRVTQQLGKSEFRTDYIIDLASPILQISTQVDWQENQVLVKTAFTFNFTADFATYEIPCGSIQRPTQPQTPAEKAKWEVPALRWADLTTETDDGNIYGVSLLNDCKYGYDAQPNQLRLTLLRSPNWPDPQADRGIHDFTYGIYPHLGDWKSAETVKKGYELNRPLSVILLDNQASNNTNLPSTGQLLNLSSHNVILMALKQSEDNSQTWVMRCYECHGEASEVHLESDLDLQISSAVDLREYPVTPDNPIQNISPWQVRSYLLSTP